LAYWSRIPAYRFWWVRYYAYCKIVHKSVKAEQKVPAQAFAKLLQ
jgi:hypothetical protein